MKKCLAIASAIVLLTSAGYGGVRAAGITSSPARASVTITYGFWDKNQAPALQQIANAFHRAHPEITVKQQVTPFAEYWTKLQTAATGGSLPDVFWMNGPNFLLYASNGILMPLSDNIKKDKVSLSNYPSSLVKLYSYQGKVYALPKDFDTIGLWYNKTLFRAAHVKFPDATWTWKTLMAAARKLTNKSKGVWGIAAQNANQEGYYNTIPENGGYVITANHKKSGYDTPNTIGGLKFWTDMIKAGVSPTNAQMTETTPISMLESGKIAMLYGGSWNAIEFNSNSYTKNRVDVAVLPKRSRLNGLCSQTMIPSRSHCSRMYSLSG